MAEPHRDRAGEVERWLAEQRDDDGERPIFWAPHGYTADDWQQVRSIEHLAVLISTALDPASNVCFASEAPDRGGLTASFIGLIQHDVVGFAVKLWHHDEGFHADVRRVGYAYDNYDSFAALPAAQIAADWIRYSRIDGHLDFRIRHR